MRAIEMMLRNNSNTEKRKENRVTDVEMQRRKMICEIAGVDDIGDLSDGFHTFNSLYEQRMIIFAVLVKVYKDKAWKSYRHEDGEYCFGGGWFIVGIDTPEGSYTYHYENKYFDLFDCEELTCGKRWDGHTEKDVTRLLTLSSAERKRGRFVRTESDGYAEWNCPECGCVFEDEEPTYNFCPNCGNDMRGE